MSVGVSLWRVTNEQWDEGHVWFWTHMYDHVVKIIKIENDVNLTISIKFKNLVRLGSVAIITIYKHVI